MIDPETLREARVSASAMGDQALAALTQPERANRLITLCAAVQANLDELARHMGSYEQAGIVLSGSINAVIMGRVAEKSRAGE